MLLLVFFPFFPRKLKNRVAAQTARDRKKAKMGELEQQVLELELEVNCPLQTGVQLEKQDPLRQEVTKFNPPSHLLFYFIFYFPLTHSWRHSL